MGTRADFYVGRGRDAEWLGSIAWDGYPGGIEPKTAETYQPWPGARMRHQEGTWPEGEHLFDATDEQTYRQRVARFFEYRDDVTLPAEGWPWPWGNSQTTDYAYAFDDGTVHASCFGYAWFDPPQAEPDHDDQKQCEFPDMKDRMNVKFGGPGSGLIVVAADAEGRVSVS